MHLIIALGSGRDVDIGGVLAVVFRLTQLSLMAPVCFHKLSIKSGHARRGWCCAFRSDFEHEATSRGRKHLKGQSFRSWGRSRTVEVIYVYTSTCTALLPAAWRRKGGGGALVDLDESTVDR